jgi:hypothetical protein
MNPLNKEIEIKRILQRVDEGMSEISPLVTKKLLEEFEKTGISPVFSKDGQITSLKINEAGAKTGLKIIVGGEETFLIDQTHWESLENQIKDFCSLDNFWFLQYNHDKYSSNSGFFSPVGKLLVVSKKSGKSKEYDIGHGSTFPSELITDIKNNFFK